MGILLLVFIFIALGIFFISRLNVSRLQKTIWSVLLFIITFSLIAFFFIQGFERGRNPRPATERLMQPVK
ncbi:hypothetical protein [Chryseobacterium sp. MYb328]|uniref:hypothetical protein n=1 Tax=Chryseobacterium sp. MYb328 TaxID=2745231 RepID=UPI0030B19B41